MTMPQILSFAVTFVMMAAFVWGRYRYDLVAAAALLLALAVGIVPFDKAFSGFSDDIVIIVGSALLVSAGIARSGIMELAIARFAPKLSGVRSQLALLVIVVTCLSAFVKNIGALAIMIPIAFQFARRSGTSPSIFLMPMAFGSLLGGLMTQVGTSPNIVVSRVREQLTGTAFTMFDFAPVGAAVAAAGMIFLMSFYWLLPVREKLGGALNEALDIKDYLTEARVVGDSTVLGKTVADVIKLAGGDAVVTSILRNRTMRMTPLPDAVLKVNDILLLEGDPAALDRLVSQGKLSVTGDRVNEEVTTSEMVAIEAVIGESSPLIGWTAQRLALYDRFNVNLLAVSRRGQRLDRRLAKVELRLGDVVVLQGNATTMPETLRGLGCLPLAERPILLGSVRKGIVPVVILALAMLTTAVGLLPVPVAFFAAAVGIVLFKVIPLRDVYQSLDGPILVMLAVLIPVSDSLRTTGATALVAAELARFGTILPAPGALMLILVAAMAVTPFLNNAATVLVMAPVASEFAADLGYRPEAFLMAVAIGAGCDFLTPIGHQCNTLVMGPGGYRFSDYPRLGLPLSFLVVIVAVPMLAIVWPMN
ncbi:SLC13 family permease [Mesorhizobium sp. M1A.F.Ca.IN.020.06.1.1]|uniref:SLC13 family permease n=1 Tax=unclassified Mesorhizobium TaxID=325217 RepID=UPI000BAEA6C2|nr:MULTISPECIES: SLC13 family permease [unclassified Mesorhizobium]PBB32362.1 SLC13 family permease [Mesorhizobium sp. WSM3882]PBB42233.1 SLC13 family permease [Mesorhizobium sp. WSM3866]RUV00606.1 SLC13 family permease [Mesorhizobium sp. M1A.F.Ca.IN.020.03.2.1]RUV82681.1 SLC13 family permease [Mesorhizobium sp. M1A.F.Ca.IN.020.32.1.1]RUW10159.1 SLC13 family permease [Mesorhizobium sp. M1A.F.Ca.IN.022.05.2.1]